MKIKNRARTDEQKKEICDRLFQCWKENKKMRFGQLISDGMKEYVADQNFSSELYYIEDRELIEEIEKFTKENNA